MEAFQSDSTTLLLIHWLLIGWLADSTPRAGYVYYTLNDFCEMTAVHARDSRVDCVSATGFRGEQMSHFSAGAAE